jgi:hypothetical protein
MSSDPTAKLPLSLTPSRSALETEGFDADLFGAAPLHTEETSAKEEGDGEDEDVFAFDVDQPFDQRPVSSDARASSTPKAGQLDKKLSVRSNFSAGSTDSVVVDDHPKNSFYFPAQQNKGMAKNRNYSMTSMSSFVYGGTRSPRKHRRAAISRKGTGENMISLADEENALLELYAIVKEENRECLVIERNSAGYLKHLELQGVSLGG